MPITLDLPPDALARLEAEAARRGTTVDALVADLAAGLGSAAPSSDSALDGFFGAGDSGDSEWASRDIHQLRHELAQRRFTESA